MLQSIFVLVASLYAVKARGILKSAKPETGGICDATVKSTSGYYTLDTGVDKNYFYWFFESRNDPKEAPFIMWLTGGPGCSSQLALMTENGPCKPSPDGLTTENNPYSWNTNANIMWVDQPSNVGFSYGDSVVDNDHNEDEVAEDMYSFLQEFFKANPEYSDREFFVFGESYGGHYAPAISNRIYKGNKNEEGLFINLKGVGVGNGLTDPVVQYQYYPEMAMNNTYDIKTVSEDAYAKMVKHLPACKALSIACQLNSSTCIAADDFCNLVETTPYYKTGLNPYDIRKPCEGDLCYDFTNVDTYLNLPSTREALHVSDKVDKWVSCNNKVNAGFASDWMSDYQQKLIPMLENGIRVLIYAGDVDFICNWMGNKAWTQQLRWSGKDSFNSEMDADWLFDNGKSGITTGGKARTAKAKSGDGSLTFLQVYEAGHMVPMDQPVAALSLLDSFLKNKPFY